MVHTFTYDGDYFALDVETGSVHMLDKPAYDAVTALAETDDVGSFLENGRTIRCWWRSRA